MRKIMIGLLLVMSMALPIAIHAQDTAPTSEAFPTIEQPPITIEPTLVATETPAPSPIDETKIPTWLGVVAIVLVVGIIAISIVGIQKAAEGLPAWARDLLLAAADSGMVSVDTYVKGTESKIDDAAAEELHRLVDQLRAELNATKAQVARNSENIAQTNQVVAQAGLDGKP